MGIFGKESSESVPLGIYVDHQLEDGSKCPINVIPFDLKASRVMGWPVYSCSWVNPVTNKACGKKFSINKEEIKIG